MSSLPSRAAARQIHRLFGLNLAADLPLATYLAAGSEPVDVSFEHFVRGSLGHKADRQTGVRLCQSEDGVILPLSGVGEFSISPERIVCRLDNVERLREMEIGLLGLVLSLWLEERGLPTLHASAVVVEGRAVAFAAANGGGKTSLAAAFMSVGYPLLTDDVLALDVNGNVLGRPGYPQMRMWPQEADYFLGGHGHLDIVHPAFEKRRTPVGPNGFGSFCDEAHPVSRLYLPERRDARDHGLQVEIGPLSPSEAVIQMLRHSFVGPALHVLGTSEVRLNLLARVAAEVPVRRVFYPSGFEHLPRVREAILADIQSF